MLVGMCRVRMSGLVVALVPAYNEESYVASVLFFPSFDFKVGIIGPGPTWSCSIAGPMAKGP